MDARTLAAVKKLWASGNATGAAVMAAIGLFCMAANAINAKNNR